MSAVRYTVCAIGCDHPGCDERSEAFEGVSATVVRELARPYGWTHVRHAGALRDYCPEHSQ